MEYIRTRFHQDVIKSSLKQASLENQALKKKSATDQLENKILKAQVNQLETQLRQEKGKQSQLKKSLELKKIIQSTEKSKNNKSMERMVQQFSFSTTPDKTTELQRAEQESIGDNRSSGTVISRSVEIGELKSRLRSEQYQSKYNYQVFYKLLQTDLGYSYQRDKAGIDKLCIESEIKKVVEQLRHLQESDRKQKEQHSLLVGKVIELQKSESIKDQTIQSLQIKNLEYNNLKKVRLYSGSLEKQK